MTSLALGLKLSAIKTLSAVQRAINILKSAGPGAWYDPSDLTTLFQDSAGTTPVTAVEQPVGKILDKSGRGNHLIQPTATSRPTLKQDGNGMYHLHFDGVDDSLYSAASIDFTTTDKMTVFAGVHKASDAGIGVLAETSTGALSGSFWLSMPATVGGPNVLFQSKGTIEKWAITSSLAAPLTRVVTGIGDISGDRVTLRLNGTQTSQDATDQGTGNYGNYPLYVGRRNNASLPFNGRLYQLALKGKSMSAAEISTVEALINSRTKAF